MDGNDSLKRILRYILGEDGQPQQSSKAFDSGQLDDSLYLAWQEVDKWANEAFQDLMGDDFSEVNTLPHSFTYL